MQLIVNELEQERLRAAVEPDAQRATTVGADNSVGSVPDAAERTGS